MPRNSNAPSSVHEQLGGLDLSEDVLLKIPDSLPNDPDVEAPDPLPPADKTPDFGEHFPVFPDTFDDLPIAAPTFPDLPIDDIA